MTPNEKMMLHTFLRMLKICIMKRGKNYLPSKS